jgi:hypothetical protein
VVRARVGRYAGGRTALVKGSGRRRRMNDTL